MTRTLLYDANNNPLVTQKTPADLDREHEILIACFGLLTGQSKNPDGMGKALMNAIVAVVGPAKLMERYPGLDIKPAPGVH